MEKNSILDLCAKEEWELIIASNPKDIASWNLEEKNKGGWNAYTICATLNVLKHFSKFKPFDYKKISFKSRSMVLLAAENGQLETLKWLLDNGASIREKDFDKNSCALLAAKQGQLETLKWLLKNGSSVDDRNSFGNSCILLAALLGKIEIIKWLLENGCSINDKNNKGFSCLKFSGS